MQTGWRFVSSRRQFLKALGGAAALSFAPAALAQMGRRKPNIVFILADDLGYGDLGCFGQRHIRTPELDRMCADGMKFTSHYAGSTVCAPSRYALLTGNHIGRSDTIGQAQELKPGTQTLGSVLQSAGYRTACIGKWGLGDGTGLPNKQGFDHFFGFVSQTHAHFHYPDYVWRNAEKVDLKDNPKTHEHYVHDLFTQEAIEFIRASKDGPFFLYLPYTIPHAEVLVPDDSLEPYIKTLGDPERPPVEAPYELKGYNWDYNERGVTSSLSALRKGKWKLVVDREKAPGKPELYDLSVDAAEKNDLADQNPETVASLLALMRTWWR